VRFFLLGVVLLLAGCGPGLEFNDSQRMSSKEMLWRADHVFIGVIQEHYFEPWLFFALNIPDEDPERTKYWRIVRREVRIESVLRGVEPRKVANIYEICWMGGRMGDWNSTQNGERDLFLVRVENGRYHVVRDWWRSIFPVTTGPHSRLPLDRTYDFWERIALMNYWIERSGATTWIDFKHIGGAFSLWRRVKLQRGLVRHPSASVRVQACRELLLSGWGQDECWDALSEDDRAHLADGGHRHYSADDISAIRQRWLGHDAAWWWTGSDRETRRLLTAVSNRKLRTDICQLYSAEYPGDLDTGCPADQPPPATIVTEQGDVPLNGPWPH